MSKTYRRKAIKTPTWAYWDRVFVEKRTEYSEYSGKYYTYSHFNYVIQKPESKEGRRLDRRYHSDVGTSISSRSVPSSFVNRYCERPFRRACKQALYNQVQHLEEDVVFPKFVKDARWLYW